MDIASAPAHEAMMQLAETTNTQLIFPFDQVKNITTNVVKGRYSFAQALAIMLKDTPLNIAQNPNGVVSVYLDMGKTKNNPDNNADDSVKSSESIKSDHRNSIEEISVTARKRLESIRDVPFSIEAKTSEVIFLSGSQNFSELARSVAGLSFTDLGPGQSQIAIRGISAGQVVRDQPGVKEQVGIYLDESVISLALFTPDLDFFDLNRIEILRGPQGTLFGAGSLSGTVRYISNPPVLSETKFITQTQIQTAKNGDWATSFKMAANIPLFEDKSAIRLVGYYNELLGYVDARLPDEKIIKNVNAGEKYGSRLALTFTPNENLSFTPRLVFQKINTGGFPRVDIYNVLANPFTESRPKITLKDNEQYIQFRESLEDNFLLTDLLINYDFPSSHLTSITSYIDRDISVVRDSGQLTTSILSQPTLFNLSGPVLYLNAPLVDKTSLHKFSQEVRLHSSDDGSLTYVIGAFYTQSNRKYGQTLQVEGFEDLSGLATATFLNRPDLLYFSSYKFDFKQWAVFGEATYALSDQLNITGGLRWFEYRESRNMILDGLFPISTSPSGVTANTVNNGLTPRFILALKASEDTQITMQIAKGFRLGGINDPLNKPLCTTEDYDVFKDRNLFKNEELWNYEIGFKSSFQEGKVTLDAAFFYADIHNLQATVDAGSCSSRVVLNVPRARSIGIETELKFKPSSELEISFSASLQNATIRSDLSALDASAQGILNGIERQNRLPTSPDFQASAQINYYWDMNSEWNGFTSLNLQYVGSSYTQIKDQVPGFGTIDLTITQHGDPNIDSFIFEPELPAYKVGNIRIGVYKDNLEISLFVNNIWNEVIRTSLDRERGGLARIGYMVSAPRTFGLAIRSNF